MLYLQKEGGVYVSVGDNIRRCRKEKGWTQARLAQELQVSQQMIGQFEKSKNPPKISTLLKIADALGVSVQSLCGDQWESINYEARTELHSPFRKYLWSLGYRTITAFESEPLGESEVNIPIGYTVISSSNQKTVFTKEQFEAFEKAIADSVNYQIWQQQHKK